MATKPMISVEEYLRSAWPDGDREYVDGAVIEKPVPPFYHGEIQVLLGAIFLALSRKSGAPRFFPVSEVRHRTSSTRFRLPDLAVFVDHRPEEMYPSTPPYAVFEILSPEDRAQELWEKLAEYRAWGAAHIWVIDYPNRLCLEFGSDGLREVSMLRLPEYGLEIASGEIFPQP